MSAVNERMGTGSTIGARITALRDRYLSGGIARTLAQGAIWSIAINVGGAVIAFGVQLLLTRSLGHVEFGRYAYALAWMNAALLVAKLELDTAALRFVGAYTGKQEWSLLRGFLRRSNQIVRLASLAAAIVGAAVVWFLTGGGAHAAATSFWAACAVLPVTAVTQFKASCLQGFKRVQAAQAPILLLRPLLFGIGLAVATYGFGRTLHAAGAIGLNFLAALPPLVLTVKYLHDVVAAEVPAVQATYETRSWLHTASQLLLIAFAQLILGTYSDVLVVGTLLGTTEAGLYSVASQLAVLVSFGVTAIVFVAVPMVSNFHATGRRADLQQLVTLVQRASVVVSLPVVALLVIEGKTVLGWFGASFVAAYPVLVILSIATFISSAVGILAGFMLALTGHQRQAAVIVVGSAVVNLVLSLTLTRAFGSVGTATATATTTLLRSGALAVYVWKLLGVRMVPTSGRATGA
jgi:O-antigen/teichoic acid export membrane protein